MGRWLWRPKHTHRLQSWKCLELNCSIDTNVQLKNTEMIAKTIFKKRLDGIFGWMSVGECEAD